MWQNANTEHYKPITRDRFHLSIGRLFFHLLFVSLMFSAALLFPSPAVPGQKNSYTIAIIPQFSPSIIEHSWMPLIERISKNSGVMLKLKFYRSIPEFEEDFMKGTPDFVYLNPYHAIMARKTQGYIPLVRDDEEALIGILVVRKDSPIKSIQELNGRRVAFPSPNAFAASLFMRALLADKEKIRIIPRYLTTHSNVYRHVALGKAAAGGGVNKTLNKESPELKRMLKIIYQTPGVASHPLCVHPRVAPSVRRAVNDTILKLADSKSGRKILKAVELSRPVQPDYDRDYQNLELLGLERLAKVESNDL